MLKMKIRRYPESFIFEFDTLDELRTFDSSYIDDTRSAILKHIAAQLGVGQRELVEVHAFKDKTNAAVGVRLKAKGKTFEYHYETKILTEV